MSVILPPVSHHLAGSAMRPGPMSPAPLHAATMAAPVATTQMKQAVRPVDGLSEPDRADMVPAQRDKDRPEPHEWLGPKPSFRLHVLDALPDSMYSEEAAEARTAEDEVQPAPAMPPADPRAVFAEFDVPPPAEESQLDRRV